MSNACCAVPGCLSIHQNNRNSIIFYNFPKRGERIVQIENHFGDIQKIDRLKAWLWRLKMRRVTDCMKVCSLHFKDDDYLYTEIGTSKRRYLKKIAVPSRIVQKTIKRSNRTERLLARNLQSQTIIDNPVEQVLLVEQTQIELQPNIISQPAKLEEVDHPDWIPTIGLPETSSTQVELESKLQNYLHELREKNAEKFAPVYVPAHCVVTCCINTCVHSSANSKCEWIKMPADNMLKKRWIRQIGKYGDTLRKNSLICTCHFDNDNDRIRGPTIFYANVEVSYNNIKTCSAQKEDMEQVPHTENVQVSDFGNTPPHQQIVIEESPEVTLNRILNSTAEQTRTALNIEKTSTKFKFYNFKNICRVCLKKGASRNIYQDNIEKIYIADMLQEVTNSQVSKTDNLPKYVCTKCVQEIFYAYKLIKKYVLSNKKLLKYIQYCEKRVDKLITLKQSIEFDHCYDSYSTTQFSEQIYVNHDLSDEESPNTDPLALETPDPGTANRTQYTPIIPAGFVNYYREMLNDEPSTGDDISKTDIPGISADFPIYMIDDSDCDDPDHILVKTDLEDTKTLDNMELETHMIIPGKSLLKNCTSTKDSSSSEIDNDDYFNLIEPEAVKSKVISAEVNKTVESFKTVLQDTSDIDDNVKVDIIDTLIELYGLKKPELNKTDSDTQILNCKQCNQIFGSYEEKRAHNCSNPILRNIKINYTDPDSRDQIDSFQCRICSNNFSNLTVLVSHECFVQFTRKRSQTTDSVIEKQFRCSECEEKFDYYSELVKHRIVTSHSDVPVVKSIEIDVATEISVAIHSEESPHNVIAVATVSLLADDNLKHKCNKCEKRFEFFSQLVQHNRSCKPPPILTCRVCNLEMKRAKYTEHMKVHNNERRYCCEFCGRSFKFGRHFKRHMEIHQGIKPFACGDCGRKFRQKSALKTHSFIHTGEKPYMCDVCGQKFRQRGTLSFHLKTKPCGNNLDDQMNNVLKLTCSVCQKKYATKSQLIVHLKSHVYVE